MPSDVNRLFERARESAPRGMLSRIEEAAQAAYRKEERARRGRRRALAVSLGVAAVVPLVLSFELSRRRPEASLIEPEKLVEKKVEAPEHVEPEPAVTRAEPVSSERPPAPTARPRAPALGQELAVLGKVRQSLHDGDPKQALAVLQQHRAALSAGQLRLEAEVLRLEALSSLGATKEASDRARVFIEQNPNSPLVDRVRGYLTE